MLVKRKGTHLDRMLVVNDDRLVTGYLCGVHNLDHSKYAEVITWAGPDREMREMMVQHLLQPASESVKATLANWC